MYPSLDNSPITESGKGVRIIGRTLSELPQDEIKALLDKFYFIVFTGKPNDVDDVENTLRTFGPLTENDRRKGAVLNIDKSKVEEGEVLLGDGFLPLHRDGGLMGTDVRMVGIFCMVHRNVTGGRTFVADSQSALNDVPQQYLDILRDKGIEGKPVDAYYLKEADTWHSAPAFFDVDGEEFLNVGFPSPKGEKKSWEIRIPGESDETFDAVFGALEKAVMDEKYCYYHEWEEGDLILFDNRRTLHGRESFKGERALANIQVLAS